MTILLPAEAEADAAGQPTERGKPDRPYSDPAIAAALGRQQAADDALFVATSLADLASRHGAALHRMDAAAFSGGEVPDGGLAHGIGAAFAADVGGILAAASSAQGAGPSEPALEQLRRGADELGQALLGRAAMSDSELHRLRQAQAAVAALDALAGLVAVDPDALAQAELHMDMIARAAAPLFGADGALHLHQAESVRLAQTAMRGLIAADPDAALERLSSGAFDDRLDPQARSRLGAQAMLRRDALAADAERAGRAAPGAETRERAARRFAFAQDFRRRLASGEATHAALADAESAGLVAPPEAASLRVALAAADAGRAAELEAAGRIGDLLDRGIQPDPLSPDDRAAANAHWRTVVEPQLDGRPAEETLATVGDYVARTGIAPAAAMGRLVTALFDADGKTRIAAAQGLAAAIADDPAAAVPVAPPILHRARQAASLAQAGLPAGLAAQPLDEIAGDLRALVSTPPDVTARTASAQEADAGSVPGTSITADSAGGRVEAVEAAPRPDAEEEQPAVTLGEQGGDAMSADKRFQLFRERLRPREGGKANVSGDRGGETNKGMSQKELNKLRARPEWAHLPARAFDLTDAQITLIFRKEYFDRLQIDKLARVPGLEAAAPTFAEQVFDSGIHSGVGVSGRQLQQALDEVLGADLRVATEQATPRYDGIIGSGTREAVAVAVREGRIAEVNNRIVELRKERYRDIVARDKKQEKFLKNWLERAESFRMP